MFIPITPQINDYAFGRFRELPSPLFGSTPPWLMQIPVNHKISLGSDIIHFIKFIQLNPSEKDKRKQLIKQVTKVIDSLKIISKNGKPKVSFISPQTPSCVTLYGSEKSNLALPFSDIDISLSGEFINVNSTIAFQFISDALANACICNEVLSLPLARIPLLKMKGIQDEINIDISIDNQNGIETTKLIGRLCHKNSMLRPLVILIRYLLHQAGFTSVMNGGLNTFMITLLVYSFLEMYNTGNITGGIPDNDIGSVFITFLQHFGYDFNYSKYGISVGVECSYFEKASRGWLDSKRPCMLTIENPFDETSNLTPNVYLTPSIKTYFANCLQWILPSMGDDIYLFLPSNSRLARIISLPEELLNRNK
ncbi:hypothetical protein, conserved [Entamoeba dispar SAW760]|uniref:Uncharacterized protein n=1 Tax=Entamoeba dispar (strain ATCC PRA-260 / SAW760) TaxID=370354 RepID=B0ERS2_ENTDS|nr:uncharacterized protein EDI_336060 [Entamoeba dispar SAW760]EDR22717.1 hypothetical protein, conserved [Entamoeba dispar SAW760]|eukprot:EDR22717.1 hypothetical protein, conserved [Entamoeba dispar SAW760]